MQKLNFSPDISLVDSSLAMREVNTELKRYFHEPQLLVFRAAILWAFISPYLRGSVSVFVFVCVCVNISCCRAHVDDLLACSVCLWAQQLWQVRQVASLQCLLWGGEGQKQE